MKINAKKSCENKQEQNNARTSQNSKLDEQNEIIFEESFELIKETTEKKEKKEKRKNDFQEILNAQYLKGIDITKSKRNLKMKIIKLMKDLNSELNKSQPKDYSDDFDSPLFDEFNSIIENEEEHKNIINKLSLFNQDSSHIEETQYKQNKKLSTYESIEKLVKKIMYKSYGKLFEEVWLKFN